MARGLLLALLLAQLVVFCSAQNACTTAAQCNGGSCTGGYCFCSLLEAQGPNCDLPPQQCHFFTCTNSRPLTTASTFLNHAFEFTGFPETIPSSAVMKVQTFFGHTNGAFPSNDAVRAFSRGSSVNLAYLNGPGLANVLNGTVWRDSAANTITNFPHVAGQISSPLRPSSPFSALYIGNGVYHTDYATIAPPLNAHSTTFSFEGLDACNPNPCLRGGICSTTDNLTYTCDCSASGFTGYRCQGCPWMTPWVAVPSVGSQGIFKVALSAQPTSPVTLSLTSDCASLSKCSVTFTPSNWNIPQALTAFRSADGACQINGEVSSQQGCTGSSSFTRLTGGTPAPSGVAINYGSTQQITFDGNYYFTFKTGDFYFLRQLGGALVIQLRLGSCVCTTSVAIRFRSLTVFVTQQGSVPAISVVGSPASEGVIIRSFGNKFQLVLPTGAIVDVDVRGLSFAYYMNVFAYLPLSYKGRLRGLIGNYDGNATNDWILPSGAQAASLDAFTEAWRVPTAENLFLNASAVIPSLGSENTTSTGLVCLPPSSADITDKLPSSGGSPLANTSTPEPQTLPQPTCDLQNTSNPVLQQAIAACSPYFNDSTAQCCSSSLKVSGDSYYVNCLCGFLAAGNGNFVIDSVTAFYSACDAATTSGGPTCAPCPSACNGNGACKPGGICACNSGFKGDDCSENWNLAPEVTQATYYTCPHRVVISGQNFFGTLLECRFNSAQGSLSPVNATKISNYQVVCNLPPVYSPTTLEVKIFRSGIFSSTFATISYEPKCCDAPCRAGAICADLQGGGISCSCPLSKYINATWPSTPALGTSSGTCDTGFSGLPSRACLAGGLWSSTVTSACVRNTCASTTEGSASWPQANSLTTVSGTCLPGYSGSPSRTCTATGTFGAISNPCVQNSACPAESYNKADWPQTSPASTATGTCQAGYTGSPQRRCTPAGTWETSISLHCQRLSCDATTEEGSSWSFTWALDTAYGTCLDGFTGRPTRVCQGTTFGPISNPCTPLASCPASNYSSATWATTSPNTVATGTCLPGFSGTPTRRCQADGTWESLVSNFCVSLNCSQTLEDNAQWPETRKGIVASGACQGGMIGAPTRMCNSDAQWGPISSPCRPFGTCPAETYVRADWPVTAPGVTATGTCIPGWDGAPKRICKADGTWQDLVNNHCTRV